MELDSMTDTQPTPTPDEMLPAVHFKLQKLGVDNDTIKGVHNSAAGEEIIKFLLAEREKQQTTLDADKPITASTLKANAAGKGPAPAAAGEPATVPATNTHAHDAMVLNPADITRFNRHMQWGPDARPLMRYNSSTGRMEVF